MLSATKPTGISKTLIKCKACNTQPIWANVCMKCLSLLCEKCGRMVLCPICNVLDKSKSLLPTENEILGPLTNECSYGCGLIDRTFVLRFHFHECSLNPINIHTTIHLLFHEHMVKKVQNNKGWKCDIIKSRGFCNSGMNEFYQSKTVSSWRCDQCDYDICENCMIELYAWDLRAKQGSYMRDLLVKPRIHKHFLIKSERKTGWVCDGGCKKHNKSSRYRCIKGCDYDLCEECLEEVIEPNYLLED